MNKIKNKYKEICDKYPEFSSVTIITSVILFAFIVTLICKTITGTTSEDQVSIATNVAEDKYYQADYEGAIKEYKKLQEDKKWPIYIAKEAEVYSVSGDIERSNELLEEATNIRNELIEGNTTEKYDDAELGNLIAFTYLMNGNNEKALEYGEYFKTANQDDKKLQKTMFTIYMVNNKIDKAKNIVDDYKVNKKSSYDLAVLARMNMLIDDWDKGFDYLKKAWKLNKDEIKVFDVIAQITAYNKDEVIMKLNELAKKDPDEVCYKVWLTKYYSMFEETTSEAEKLLDELKGKDVGTVVFNTVIAKVYQHDGKKEEAEKLLKKIINDESFIGYHTAAWYYYDMGQYDKAFELCKKSINENKDYPDNYGFLIPEILNKKEEGKVAEGYFRTALYKEPFNYNIMLNIANYYYQTVSDLDTAYYYYNMASLIKPKDAEIKYNKALIDLTNEKTDEAIKLLKECIELDNENTKYHRTLGTVYLNEGKEEDAINEIRLAYAADKSDILTLNNAGCYYITIEQNIERGLTNLKAAYEGITDTTDPEEAKNISDNYQKAKDLYNAYNKRDGATITIPDFILFY